MKELAADIGPNVGAAKGFGGISLAHNVRRKEEVEEVLALAEKAGSKIVKPAHDTFWGGYGGYFQTSMAITGKWLGARCSALMTAARWSSNVMNKLLAVLLFSLVICPVQAAEPSPALRTEVDSLLNSLGSSNCEFYRNGSWYTPAKARSHLQRKLDYLLKQGLISTTEEFILAAGTKSSSSGKPYQVRCPGAEPKPSAMWLQEELEKLRQR